VCTVGTRVGATVGRRGGSQRAESSALSAAARGRYATARASPSRCAAPRSGRDQVPPPPCPRTNRTRLVPPPVLTGHVAARAPAPLGAPVRLPRAAARRRRRRRRPERDSRALVRRAAGGGGRRGGGGRGGVGRREGALCRGVALCRWGALCRERHSCRRQRPPRPRPARAPGGAAPAGALGVTAAPLCTQVLSHNLALCDVPPALAAQLGGEGPLLSRYTNPPCAPSISAPLCSRRAASKRPRSARRRPLTPRRGRSAALPTAQLRAVDARSGRVRAAVAVPLAPSVASAAPPLRFELAVCAIFRDQAGPPRPYVPTNRRGFTFYKLTIPRVPCCARVPPLWSCAARTVTGLAECVS